MKVIAYCLGCGLSLLALLVGAEEAAGQSEADERYAELVKRDGKFDEVFVLPGTDMGRYDKVFLWGAQFEYRDVGPAQETRTTVLSTHKREFGISEDDRKKFEEAVGEAFRKEVNKGKQFRVIDSIDEADASTLIMRGALVDIVSRVPPDTVGRSDVYLSSVGAATFAIELIDAQSGVVIALVAERRSIDTLNSQSGVASVPANSASILGDIRRWAGSLARRLRTSLDKVIDKEITT